MPSLTTAARTVAKVCVCAALAAPIGGCALFSSPTPTPAAPAKKAAPKPVPKATPAAQPVAERGATSNDSAAQWIERDGLRFLVRPSVAKLSGGYGVKIEIDVRAADNATHVLYGYSKGLALSGVRFGNMNGMMPMSEGGKVTRHGRVRPGATLVLKREFPGPEGAAAGWTPLKAGDSMVLSLKTWASKGADPVSNPKPIDIAGITLSVDDQGKPEVAVERAKE